MEREKQKQEEQKKEHQNKKQDADLEGPKEEELVPDKLARVEDPLEQAIHFLKPLQLLCADMIETHIYAYEIYSRKGKLLLMLQSLKRSHKVDPDNPHLHVSLLRFLKLVNQKKVESSETVHKVIQHELERICGNKDAKVLNEEFLKRNSNSVLHRAAAAKMMYEYEPTPEMQEKALNLATKLSWDLSGLTVKNCIEVLEYMCRGEFGKCEKAVQDYQVQCHNLFPCAPSFIIPANSQPDQIVANGTAS